MNAVAIGLMALGAVIGIVGAIWFLVAAFRAGVLWGLAVLLLPPAGFAIWFMVGAFRLNAHWGIAALLPMSAGLVFLIARWRLAWKPFLVQVLANMLYFGGVAVMAVYVGVVAARDLLPLMRKWAAEMKAGEWPSEWASAASDPTDAASATDSGDSGAKPPPPTHELKKADIAADPALLTGRLLTEVEQILGAPRGRMAIGPNVSLLYDGFSVFSDDGRTVATVQFDGAHGTAPTGAAARRPAQAPKPSRSPARPAASPPANVEAVRTLSAGGRRVEMSELLAPGKVTIVDFYADWCGPCRQLGPLLERLARDDADVVLRKVDIVRWGTDVCSQYAIRSVPDVRVFDRKGRMVGRPTHEWMTIVDNVRRAK